MPFVFVHGVNTRSDDDYARHERLRNAFLREFVGPKVGISPKSTIYSPYWGGDGVRFWRNLQVVPMGGGGAETFGASDPMPPSIGIALGEKATDRDDSIESIARKTPNVAVDLLWDYAATQAKDEKELVQLAASYREANAKIDRDATNTWLSATTARDFADDVFTGVTTAKTETETFGANKLYSMLAEAGKRIAMKPANMLSAGAVALGRRPLTHRIATFAGDAFEYLAQRGDGETPGPITKIVLDDVLAARKDANASGEPLVVICHSFGGEILYDILTHYALNLDLVVDTWVTVGSQVGLFEEMSLLCASPGRTNPARGDEPIEAPTSVKRWINIVDSNDIFGFLVLPVFTGATQGAVNDFMYDTGYPVAGAHSGYFEWPSFYRRLATRLKAT